MGKLSSIEKLKRLCNKEKFKTLDINDVVQPFLKLSQFKDSIFYSAVMRFEISGKSPRLAVYKIMLLIDSNIYLYSRFKDGVIDLNSWKSIFNFNDDKESRDTWSKYVGNPIEINFKN